ncbi:hypothetical protein [Microbacterium sp.]|uniref:hypothetical protein n=1 Tax=Microbacterium sp. TaxID=51671 RepID=UPI002CB7B17A|nr:hypothetical protein [Microbacterium sp.]HWK78063.1 hypothetical protein [Microbacterium sp.]
MSIPPAPDVLTAVPLGRVPNSREVRIRRNVSMILSCLAIGAAATTLAFEIFDRRFLSLDGSDGMDPFRMLLWNVAPYWSVPAVASLILLGSLPRPLTLSERLPKPLGIAAIVLAAACYLYPAALASLFVMSFIVPVGLIG